MTASGVQIFRIITLYLALTAANGTAKFSSIPHERGYINRPHAAHFARSKFELTAVEKTAKITDLCQNTAKRFGDFSWQENPCGSVNWLADFQTLNGRPLLYASFGSGPDSTLILGGIHADELTSILLAFQFARHLHENPDIYRETNSRIVVAPLVNPDGFFHNPPLRTNGVVDLNRNFPTKDWYKNALSSWVKRTKAKPRYFPGYLPATEVETLFQMELINISNPNKIIAIHSPLGFLDYDGPGDHGRHHPAHTVTRAREFIDIVSKKSDRYRVVNFSVYPGSIGTYAGAERSTPTLTLELENSTPAFANKFWQKFRPGLIHSVQNKLL